MTSAMECNCEKMVMKVFSLYSISAHSIRRMVDILHAKFSKIRSRKIILVKDNNHLSSLETLFTNKSKFKFLKIENTNQTNRL